MLQQIGSRAKQSSETECDFEKRAVVKVLLSSTWLNRLYFIIRSSIMGLIGAVLTFLIIFSVGTINAITGIILGIVVFAISLAITRMFDKQLNHATKKIVDLMAGHKKHRDFIMKYF